MYIGLWVCAHECSAVRGQQRSAGPLELELKAVKSHPGALEEQQAVLATDHLSSSKFFMQEHSGGMLSSVLCGWLNGLLCHVKLEICLAYRARHTFACYYACFIWFL